MPVLNLQDIHRIKKLRIERFWQYLDDAGRVDFSFKKNLGPFKGIKDCWKNEPCIVVGAGPSLKGFDFSRLKNIHSIGINHVIEDYSDFDWFLFLDQRFLKKTTYDLKKYKGKIFCQNTCFVHPGTDTVKFKTIKHRKEIDLDIAKGLYNGCLSGLAALHLALISGANPIYLIGIDCGGGVYYDFHYKKDYTGATRSQERWQKYRGTANYFKKFSKWKNRVINLSDISNIKIFKKKNISEVLVLNPKKGKIEVNKKPTICHVISMNNMSEMGDISRQIYEKSWGNHVFSHIEKELPKADIYFLECFINKSQKFKEFKSKYKNSKIISLIHSSSSCVPSKNSHKVIVLTKVWQELMKKRGINSEVINAAINMENYIHEIDYSKKIFGRITRYSPGKVHPEWNNIARKVLEKYEDAKCIMYTKKTKKILQHKRMIIDDSISIAEHAKKAKKLSELTIFADMHNTFIETFSLCLLEAMATGLCIILHSKNPQPAMIEILGNSGIVCNTPKQFEEKLIKLLPDTDCKKEWGLKAKKRAKEFTIDKMIEKYNKVFKEVLK
jgi:glycosyltransferase involved in cell wall biosynthesis